MPELLVILSVPAGVALMACTFVFTLGALGRPVSTDATASQGRSER